MNNDKLPHEKTEEKIKEIIARNKEIRTRKKAELYNAITQLNQLLNSYFPNKEV